MIEYVSCEDCLYSDICHNFDAFLGCSDGISTDTVGNMSYDLQTMNTIVGKNNELKQTYHDKN